MSGVSDLRRRRGELITERNRLYEAEALLASACRVLIAIPGNPIGTSARDGILRTCEAIRTRAEGLQWQVDEIDLQTTEAHA